MQTLGVLTYPALSITGRIAAAESLAAVIDTINHLLQHRAKRSSCCCPNSPIETTHNILTRKLHAWMSLCRVQYRGVQTAGLWEMVRVEKCNHITCPGSASQSAHHPRDDVGSWFGHLTPSMVWQKGKGKSPLVLLCLRHLGHAAPCTLLVVALFCTRVLIYTGTALTVQSITSGSSWQHGNEFLWLKPASCSSLIAFSRVSISAYRFGFLFLFKKNIIALNTSYFFLSVYADEFPFSSCGCFYQNENYNIKIKIS